MYKHIHYVYVVIFPLLFLREYHCYPQLRLVQIITRHGDRSATVPYPNDPYKETIWPQGTGQLTQKGMQQMYRLGLFIRERYRGFFSEEYNHREWYTRSTDRDRTLMSAQTLMAGVFPPSGEQIWNEKIPWQPAAIHTVPISEDKFLEQSVSTVPCPRYMQLLEETRQSDAYKKENETFKDIYDFVLPYSGFTPPLTPVLLWNVWDTLNTQNFNNKTLPAWVTEDVMTIIPQQVIPFEYRSRFLPSEKTRLLSGVQMWTLTNNMLDWIGGRIDRRLKVNYFSAHDDNILTLLLAFGAYYDKMVPYASIMFIELHETTMNEFAVAVSLKNQTDGEFVINLTIPGCTFYCPIDQFMNLTKQYSLHPNDHDEACQLVEAIKQNDLLAIVIVLGAFVLTTFLVGIIYFKPHAKKGRKAYNSL